MTRGVEHEKMTEVEMVTDEQAGIDGLSRVNFQGNIEIGYSVVISRCCENRYHPYNVLLPPLWGPFVSLRIIRLTNY